MTKDADLANRETLLAKMVLDPIGAFLAVSDVLAKADDEIAEIAAQRDELLIVCQSLVANLPDDIFEWIGDSISWSNVSAIKAARDNTRTLLAKIKEAQ